MTVADVETMIIKAGVNEVDIGKVHLDQPVKVSLDAYPKVKFAGQIKRIAPARILDARVRASGDQELQRLQPLQPRSIEDRRLTVRLQIEPRLCFQKRTAYGVVIAPHRGPQRPAGVGSLPNQESHQRGILAAGIGVPDRRRAEITLVLVHRHFRLQRRACLEQRGHGLDAVRLTLLRAGFGGACDVNGHPPPRVARRHERRRRRDDVLHLGNVP